jgi:formyl-CoA transferase
MSGLMSVTGERDELPGGGPQKAGIPISDIITGMYAAVSVCAALANRAETGTGQHLDLALLDSSVAILANQGANFLATGKVPKGIGNAHPNIVPYQPFRTADGDVIVACGNDGQFRKFCEVAGCVHLVDDPRFASNGKRVENRAELTQTIAGIMAKRPTREWVEALEAAGVPNGPINTLDQVFQEPQAIARALRIELPHPTAGKVSLVRSPMRFSETPVEHALPPPVLGQHTEEILRGVLELSDAEIVRLRADGVV